MCTWSKPGLALPHFKHSIQRVMAEHTTIALNPY